VNREELRAAILASDDLPREPFDVPWNTGGTKLYVRGLTAAEKDGWYAEAMPDGDFRWSENMTASIVVKCLVTEDGEPVLEPGDVEAMGRKSSVVLGEIRDKVLELSGLTEEAAADFVGAPIGRSTSG
jgi:hypothetical protein